MTLLLQGLLRRNIHIKRFEEIPIADTELIFPDKTIFLKPLTILQLAVTLIGGIVAAIVTLWGVCAFRQLTPSAFFCLQGPKPCWECSPSFDAHFFRDALQCKVSTHAKLESCGLLIFLPQIPLCLPCRARPA